MDMNTINFELNKNLKNKSWRKNKLKIKWKPEFEINSIKHFDLVKNFFFLYLLLSILLISFWLGWIFIFLTFFIFLYVIMLFVNETLIYSVYKEKIKNKILKVKKNIIFEKILYAFDIIYTPVSILQYLLFNFKIKNSTIFKLLIENLEVSKKMYISEIYNNINMHFKDWNIYFEIDIKNTEFWKLFENDNNKKIIISTKLFNKIKDLENDNYLSTINTINNLNKIMKKNNKKYIKNALIYYLSSIINIESWPELKDINTIKWKKEFNTYIKSIIIEWLAKYIEENNKEIDDYIFNYIIKYEEIKEQEEIEKKKIEELEKQEELEKIKKQQEALQWLEEINKKLTEKENWKKLIEELKKWTKTNNKKEAIILNK